MAGDDAAVSARERILATAYALFSRRGIRDVGIDEVVARAGVAKATLYKYFRSKDELVLAFLERREQLWTHGLVEEQSHRRGATPEARLMAIFDVFDEWFAGDDFDACSFVNVLLEMGADHPTGQASIAYLENVRSLLRTRAEQAGLQDPDDFACRCHILMNGSIIAAAEGDRHAARHAQAMAHALISDHRSDVPAASPPIDNHRTNSGDPETMTQLGVDDFALAPHDHLVNIYDTDDDVIDDVSRYLAEGLTADDAVVVIATSAHRDAFARRLIDHGIDLSAAREAGRYQALDAAETLASFMVDGALSPDRFVDVIGGVITAAGSGGRPVRAFGEMVALLWADDDVAGAIQLEAMWNDLARRHRFFLYCAYSADLLTRDGDLAGMQQVCAHHSSVVAPKTYGWADTRIDGDAAPQDEDVTEVEFTELYVPVPSAVRAARHFVKDRLTAWGQEAMVDDAALVVSELATNAVVHAESAFRVSVTRADTAVRIAVEDLNPDQPVLHRRGEPPGGRGLLLVVGLCSRWGVDAGPNGKSVWGELPCSSNQRRSQ